MARQRDVILHLVPGPFGDVAEGVFLAVDHALLQRQVDLADVHLDRRGPSISNDMIRVLLPGVRSLDLEGRRGSRQGARCL